MNATIKSVELNADDQNLVEVQVDYDNGKEIISKTYKYNNVNLQSKDQVLEMIQKELGVVTGFKQVVDDLKAEIDVPIEVKNG